MKVFVLCFLVSSSVLYSAVAVPERCNLPVTKGPCQASISNYFYNAQSGRCEQFMYSGCGGNGNRFMSLDDCIHSCSCHVKPDAGPCKAVKEKWYYNPARGCCEKFLYGGCQGNSNNFQSYEECNKQCSGSFTISLKPAGLNWGSTKITSISGDRSMGGTFGKKFGGSRTVWLQSEKAPVVNKGVMTAMSRSGGVMGTGNNYQVVGREITGPGLVQAEKTKKSWSSGPMQTGGRRTVSISSSGPVVSGGMTRMSSGSGSLGQGMPDFAMNSISGKLGGNANPGGLSVSSQGGVLSGGAMGGGRMTGGVMGGMPGGMMGGMRGGSAGGMTGGSAGGMTGGSAGGMPGGMMGGMGGGSAGGMPGGMMGGMRGGSAGGMTGGIMGGMSGGARGGGKSMKFGGGRMASSPMMGNIVV